MRARVMAVVASTGVVMVMAGGSAADVTPGVAAPRTKAAPPALLGSAPAVQVLHGTAGVRANGTHAVRAGTHTGATATGYMFLTTDSRGRPSHFDRCTPVRYRVNWSGAPTQFRAELETALAKLSAASGLRFSYAGSSSVVPYRTSTWTRSLPSDQPAEVYLAWSDSTRVSRLSGSVVGVGGHRSSWRRGGREPRITVGGLVLDRAATLRAGFGPGSTRGHVLLHELGHVVNLAHVGDPRQVMYPSTSTHPRGDYQRGDLAGLARLRSYPCF